MKARWIKYEHQISCYTRLLLVKQVQPKSGLPVLWRLHFQLMLQFVL